MFEEEDLIELSESVPLNSRVCLNLSGKIIVSDDIEKIKNHFSMITTIFGHAFDLSKEINLHFEGDSYSGRANGESNITLGLWNEAIASHEYGHLLLTKNGLKIEIENGRHLLNLLGSLHETFADLVAVITANDIRYMETVLRETSHMPSRFYQNGKRPGKLRSFAEKISEQEVNETDTNYKRLAMVKYHIGKKIKDMTQIEKARYSKKVADVFTKYYLDASKNESLIPVKWSTVNKEIIELLDRGTTP